MQLTVRLVLLVLVLASCATTPPKYSAADIQQASTQQDRVALYERIKNELALKPDGPNAAAYRQLLSDLGARLAADRAEEIRAAVEAARLDSGVVPFNRLSTAHEQAAEIQTWSASAYQDLIDYIDAEWARTKQELAQQEEALETLDETADAVARVRVFERIRDLYGDNEVAEQNYRTAKQIAANQLAREGNIALENGDATTALSRFERLREVHPDHPGLDRLLAAARAGLRAAEFSDLLLSGDTDSAYDVFIEVSARELPHASIQQFETPAALLAEYFVSNAEAMMDSGQYSEAYRLLRRARAVHQWIRPSEPFDSPVVKRFADTMFDLAAASGARDLTSLEFGYLLLVEEFMPNYESLERLRREAADAIYDGAVRWVSTVSLDSQNPEDSGIGTRIAAEVNQYLLDHIPDDVRLVEREYLADIERERGLDDEQEDIIIDQSELRAADLLIQGTVLDARVDTEVKEGFKRMRVVTGQKEVPNPAYAEWIEEKGPRGENDPNAPPKTIMQDVEEDLRVSVELHRKAGFVGVTYRVVDARSAKVIHTNSINRSADYRDEATEGVELGSFSQEFKLADLPPDMEIYSNLSSEVAIAMGEDLVTILANPDGSYYLQCQALAAEGENLAAAELCASAVALLEFKERDVSEVLPLFKVVTLESGMRPD
ncbi:MAG: hypothetical protein R3200_13590 [Xanthomonadales bacterium]|nr:hypothetical protein [Xanthomonadales bacterium]